MGWVNNSSLIKMRAGRGGWGVLESPRNTEVELNKYEVLVIRDKGLIISGPPSIYDL